MGIRTSPPIGTDRRIGVGFTSIYGQPDSDRIQFWIAGEHGSTTSYVTANEARKLAVDLLSAADEFDMATGKRKAA